MPVLIRAAQFLGVPSIRRSVRHPQLSMRGNTCAGTIRSAAFRIPRVTIFRYFSCKKNGKERLDPCANCRSGSFS